MKAEIINTEYNGNERTDIVRHAYTLADDYIRLGQLYYSLGKAMEKQSGEVGSLQQMINTQEQIIKGYGDANAADHAAE